MTNKKPVIADQELYDEVKKQLYKKIKTHSAYRSGLLVQKYKEEFKKKHGNRKQPYLGKKPTKVQPGIRRWFAEDWRNQEGNIGYDSDDDIYRPTKRISKKTPTTMGELSKKEIKRAQKEKKNTGRVKKFQKGGEPKKKYGVYKFPDYPDFKPNLSPSEMFKLGSFGGTYWRPIYSEVTKKRYTNQHKKYPAEWWKGLPNKMLSRPFDKYDRKINKYGVQVGTTLRFWEGKGWITKHHPYGWVQWYCDFFMGKRSPDDERQIKRWTRLAGEKGRFRLSLITQIQKKGTDKDWNNPIISPKIRQVLQHWGYRLTKKDYNKEVKRRNS